MFYCDTKHSEILRGSRQVYCYVFLCNARPYKSSSWTLQNRNYVRRSCHLYCLCFKLTSWCFSGEAWYIVANQPLPLNKPKNKAFIGLFDTNSFTQSLTRMYHHTATESLYRLRGAKVSWTPTFAGVPYQFGCVRFSIFLQCKISRSSAFSIFFPWILTL